MPDDAPNPTPAPLTLRRRLDLAYPRTTRLIALLYLAYAAFAFAVYAISNSTGRGISICTFKNLTGHPCATCGGTRAAIRLAHLDLPGAIEYNPFATLLIFAFFAWLIIAFVRAGRPLIRWTARRRTIAASIIALALLANWAYVWNAEPRLTARDQAAQASQQAPPPFSIPR